MSERPATILVVDDIASNRDLLVRRLERSGFHTIAAGDGPEALSMLRRFAVDLVLLDVMMPGMSGIDVLKELRKTWSSAGLPVVMVTAKTESEDVIDALGAGANDYITKPLDYPVVLARILAHLRTRDATRAEAGPATVLEPPSPAHALPGAILGNRYLLESRIGGGSYGTVFRARHTELDRVVAVKILATSANTDPEALARFRREGVSACRVQHPNAVAVLDFGVNDHGVAYLVMELLEGRSLDKELETEARLGPARCAQILVPICGALAVAHAVGVVHRDVKPSNIFLHRAAEGEVPKLLDFGIARIVGDAALSSSLTVDGSLFGTPAYMAPERFRRGAYGTKSDIYSLGTVLYEMLSGRLPFMPSTPDPLALMALQTEEEPPPLEQFAPDVPPGMERLVREALSPSPDNRPTADEFARRLSLNSPDTFTPLDDEPEA